MKKYVLLAMMITIATSFSASAQGKKGKDERKPERTEQRNDGRNQERFEEFKAQRVAYITKELDLSEKEAQAFWPICNELQEKKFELMKANREGMKDIFQKIRNKETVSSEEYTKIIKANADVKIKETELDKTYLEKMLTVLPAEKVFKYQHAEQRFAKQTLEKRERPMK